jgi:hypothetical protein
MRHHKALTVLAFGAAIGIGAIAGAAGGHTRTVYVTQPPASAPSAAKSTTAAPPALPAGQKLGTWSGTGNAVTGAFTAPDTGSYIVSWKYDGNSDTYGPSNFAVTPTDSQALALSLPNDIQAQGSGSTEISDVPAGSPESFNVQSLKGCHWTITVKSAP